MSGPLPSCQVPSHTGQSKLHFCIFWPVLELFASSGRLAAGATHGSRKQTMSQGPGQQASGRKQDCWPIERLAPRDPSKPACREAIQDQTLEVTGWRCLGSGARGSEAIIPSRPVRWSTVPKSSQEAEVIQGQRAQGERLQNHQSAVIRSSPFDCMLGQITGYPARRTAWISLGA